MAWSKRKPYYNLKQSMREFFSASARYLRDSQTKESFMEKPYKQLDRGAMHQAWPKYVFPPRAKYPPLPPWQPWKPPIAGGVGRPGIMFPQLRWPGVDPTNPTAVSIRPQKNVSGGLSTSPASPSDTQGGMWIQPTCGLESGTPGCLDIGESAIVIAATNGDAIPSGWGIEIDDPEALQAIIIWDTKLSLSPDGVPTYGRKGGQYIANPTSPLAQGTVYIELTALKEQSDQSVNVQVWASFAHKGKTYINRCGSFNVTIPCGCTGDETPVAWDYGSSDETIVRNGTANVVVTPGVSPYTWSVTGTGFSIPPTTTGPTNTLSADGTACGSATITVTDFCGNVTTGYVREEDNSEWSAIAGDVCIISGAADWVSYGIQDWKLDGTLIQGKYKSVVRMGGAYGGNGCVSCGSAAFPGAITCAEYCGTANCMQPGGCTECLTGFVPKGGYTGSWNCWGKTSTVCGGGTTWTLLVCACPSRILNYEWICS